MRTRLWTESFRCSGQKTWSWFSVTADSTISTRNCSRACARDVLADRLAALRNCNSRRPTTDAKHTPQSLRTGLQPLAPQLWSPIRIRTRVIVKCADKFGPISRIRGLPVAGIRWLQHVVALTENFLTLNDVIERHSVGVSQHVIKHHERGCATEARFAMEMRPCILREPANRDDKSVNGTVERTGVVRNRDAHVVCAGIFDNVLLHACTLHGHPLRRDRTAVSVFNRLAGPNIDVTAGLE